MMELQIKPKELAKRLSLLKPFTSDIMPALDGFLFKDGMIHASDVSVFASIESGVEFEGAFATPGKLLIQVLKSIDGDASLEVGNIITIRADDAEFTLPRNNPEDFPEIKKPIVGVDVTHGYTIKSVALKRIVEKSIWAIPPRDPRQVLMGLKFDGQYAWATDGRVLSRLAASDFPEALIPAKTLQNILPFLDLDESLGIIADGNRCHFYGEHWAVSCGCIEGTYPNASAVLPTSYSCHAQLKVNRFRSIVDQASIMADDKHHLINLKIQNGRVDIAAQGTDLGSFSGFFGAEFDDGSIDISFNADYLNRMLSAVESDSITINIKDANSPVTIEQPDAPDTLFLVMPVRKNELNNKSSGD